MPIDYGSIIKLLIVYGALLQILGEYSKEIPFPKHVDKAENSLIWAVKVKEAGKKEKSVTERNSVNNPIQSGVQEIANQCKLIFIDHVEVMENTYLLGFDFNKLDHFISNSENGSYAFELDHRKLYIKLLHDLYVSHIPDVSFKFISGALSQCLDSHLMVELFSQQNIRRRTKREVDLHFTDPYFKLQWHLVSSTLMSLNLSKSLFNLDTTAPYCCFRCSKLLKVN